MNSFPFSFNRFLPVNLLKLSQYLDCSFLFLLNNVEHVLRVLALCI